MSKEEGRERQAREARNQRGKNLVARSFTLLHCNTAFRAWSFRTVQRRWRAKVEKAKNIPARGKNGYTRLEFFFVVFVVRWSARPPACLHRHCGRRRSVRPSSVPAERPSAGKSPNGLCHSTGRATIASVPERRYLVRLLGRWSAFRLWRLLLWLRACDLPFFPTPFS